MKGLVIGKRVLMIVVMAVTAILVLTAGDLDHDEYIEANLQPKTQLPFYYGE